MTTITIDRAVVEQALEALEKVWMLGDREAIIVNPSIKALRAALEAPQAEPEQEPVAYASSADWRKNQLLSKAQYDNCLPKNRADFDVPLYTAPTPQAEPVQEPIGYFSVNDYGRWEENESEYGEPLYTAPTPRKPLTDEEIMAIGRDLGKKCVLGGNPNIDFDYARAIERAHGITGEAA